MPFNDTEKQKQNKSSAKEPYKKGSVREPASKTAARGAAAKTTAATSGKAPSAKAQPDKAAPEKTGGKTLVKGSRAVYHKGEAAKAKPAGKAAAKTGPAKDGKKLVDAKTAAAIAREEAKAKRDRAAKGDPGAIIAAALSDSEPHVDFSSFGKPDDGPAAPPRVTGSIFAAAVSEGAEVWDGAEFNTMQLRTDLVAEAAQARVEGSDNTPQNLEEMAGLLDGGVQEETARVSGASTGELPAFKRRDKKKKKRKKSAAKARGAALSFPANRGEGGNVVFRAIGGFLYALGFYAECKVLLCARFVRDLGIYIGQILAWVFGGLFSSIGRLILSIVRDFIAPFRRAGNEFKHRQESQKGAAEDPGGEMAVVYPTLAAKNRHKARNLLGLAMPAAALVVLCFVVWNIFGMQYGLAVRVDGQTIGHITDRTVLEDAKNIIRGRLRLAEGQEMSDAQFNLDLNIEKTADFTSKDQLVDEYLLSTRGDVTMADGLNINGTVYAATYDGDELQKFLQEKKDAYFDPDMPDAQIEFVDDVEYDPDTVHITAGVKDIEALKEDLNQTVTDTSNYVARGEETLADIASSNGISMEALRAANEFLAAEGDDFVPGAGTELVIERERPFLQVKKVVRQVVQEAIPFETVEEETEEYTRGSRFVTQQGSEGLRDACYELTYVDGVLVSNELVPEETVVHSEPVNEHVMVGVAEPPTITNSTVANSLNPNISGPGNYLFPVPDMIYSSRGVSSGHRGRDINAVHGAPIYACNDGVVIYAGWHYSWGNYVQIQHPDGYSTLYAHASALFVTQGQVVSRGQHIAAIGSTGYSFGDHLHLEVWAPGGGLLDPDGFVTPPRPY